MKPNTMQSTVPLRSRQKAFVSATAPVLAASRRWLGLLLRQRERMAPFWTSFMFRSSPYVWLFRSKAWLITISGRILEDDVRRKGICCISFVDPKRASLILFQKCRNCGKRFSLHTGLCVWRSTEQAIQFQLSFLLLERLTYSEIFLNLLWVSMYICLNFPPKTWVILFCSPSGIYTMLWPEVIGAIITTY